MGVGGWGLGLGVGAGLGLRRTLSVLPMPLTVRVVMPLTPLLGLSLILMGTLTVKRRSVVGTKVTWLGLGLRVGVRVGVGVRGWG